MTMDQSELSTLNGINSRMASERIPNVIFLVLCMILGLCGNITVLYIYIFRMKSARRNRYFIPFLAAIDTCICAVVPTFWIIIDLNTVVPKGKSLCQGFYFSISSLVVTSEFFMLAIAVQRYRVVCKPTAKPVTYTYKRLMAAILFIGGIIVSIPTFFFYGEFKFVFNEHRFSYSNISFHQCGELHGSPSFEKGIVAYTILRAIVPSVIVVCMTSLYVFIARTVYKQFKSIKLRKMKTTITGEPSTQDSTSDSSLKRSVTLQQKYVNDFTTTDSDGRCECTEKNQAGTLNRNQRNPRIVDVQKQLNRMISRENLKTVPYGKSLRRHFRNHQFTYLFMAISVVFILTLIPASVLMVFEAYSHTFWYHLKPIQLHVLLFLRGGHIYSSVFNPIMYTIFDKLFRKELRKTFFRCKLKGAS